MLIKTSFTNFSGGTLTGGTYQITGRDSLDTGRLQFAGANIVTNAATLELDGPNAEIVDSASPTPNNGLTKFATNTQSLTLDSGFNLPVGKFTNSGTVAIGSGSTLTASNYTQTGGNTSLNGGTLTAPVTIQAGGLNGDGTVNGSVNSAGQVEGDSGGAYHHRRLGYIRHR
jgi:hypothetical protein